MDDEDGRTARSESLFLRPASPPTENIENPLSTKMGGQEAVDPPASSLMDEIQALKDKLLQLERQAVAESGSLEGDDPSLSRPETGPRTENPESHLMKQMEEYRRMEQCLYTHRKEWETHQGPEDWRYIAQDRVYFKGSRARRDSTDLDHFIPYERPDPFDPSHQCGAVPRTSANADLDAFDYVIDYASRRERLRQNFEWDLDRLYLAEETNQRRLDRIAEDEARRKRDEAITEATRITPDETKVAPWTEEEVNNKLDPGIPPKIKLEEPVNQVRRMDWLSFQKSADPSNPGACNIDILVGEPVITETRNPSYMAALQRGRKTAVIETRPVAVVSAPGKGPLPERIRIHSLLLQSILTKIVGKEVGEGGYPHFVFLRPFKTLTYYEEALRHWHSVLKKKFRHRYPIETDGTACTPGASKDLELYHSADFSDLNTGSSEFEKGPLLPNVEAKSSSRSGTDGMEVGEKKEQGNEENSDDDDNEDDSEHDSKDETRTSAAMKHVETLLNFIDTEISARRDYLNSPGCKKIYFSDLWHLFRPGMEVIRNDGRQVYRVVKVSSARHRVVPAWQMYYSNENDKKNQSPPFNITCVYVDFNGRDLGPVKVDFAFPRFNGERDVTSFSVYPFRFHPHRRSEFSDSEWKFISRLPEEQWLKAKLVRRGQRFLEVAGIKQMYYAGPTINERDEIESQVVVDFETALSIQEQQSWKPELQMLVEEQSEEEAVRDGRCNAECCYHQHVHDDQYVDERQASEYIDRVLPKTGGNDAPPSVSVIPRPLKEIKMSTDAEHHHMIPEGDLLIMSYRVFGFVLRNRKWAQLDLTHMTDLYTSDLDEVALIREEGDHNSQRKTAFDRLVLEDGHKDMIVSLTAQHFRDKESAASGPMEQVDIVKGKGKGLIILLHGAPGVGKTSTAEGVAEVFKRPLFQITCGDLGTTAKEVELALETNFNLANKWGCILLLDEADVFLAQRTKEDFVRNGLVAVFLRVMEYYSGVLFLTTNRVGDFDEAFTSRIHVSLYYPELNREKTGDVFKINLDMIEERFRKKKRGIKMDRFKIGAFATDQSLQTKWNGRQIRNACQTALALAEFDAHGSSHEQTLKPGQPNVTVQLDVKHFKTVQAAYMEFTKYINEIYGANEARRAKERFIRAMVDDKGNMSNTEAVKNAFAAAANAPSQVGASVPAAVPGLYGPPQPHSAAPGYQQPTAPGIHQQGNYSQYSGMPNVYAPPGHQQQIPGNMPYTSAMMDPNALQNTAGSYNTGVQQISSAQQPQQPADQHQSGQQQPWLNQRT